MFDVVSEHAFIIPSISLSVSARYTKQESDNKYYSKTEIDSLIPSVAAFDCYNTEDSETFREPPVIMNVNTVRYNSGHFTFSGGVVTILRTAIYKINYTASMTINGTSQASAAAYILHNGFSIAGSVSYGFCRTIHVGRNSCNSSVIINLTMDDTININVLKAQGAGQLNTIAGACNFNIVSL